MKILLFAMVAICFASAGKRNGKVENVGINNIQVSTKDAQISISKDHVYLKSPKEGDSVWVTPGPGAPDIYRDSRMIKETSTGQ